LVLNLNNLDDMKNELGMLKDQAMDSDASLMEEAEDKICESYMEMSAAP
jgi:hypothetical protein